MAQQKSVLGKGLASLLPGADLVQSAPPVGSAIPEDWEVSAPPTTVKPSAVIPNNERHPGISLADPEKIQINPFQPRREFDPAQIQELADSIRANGLIQPIVVRKVPDGYQLIAGERRLRAVKMLGLKQVPIVIRWSTDRESLELALIENIQRDDLNCVDQAQAYFRLMHEFSLTQEEVAGRVGKDRASVANYLRVLQLPEAILECLKKKQLSFGHAKAILGIEDREARLKVFKEITEKHLSVRQTEALAAQIKDEKPGAVAAQEVLVEPASAAKARLQTLSQNLTRHWSAKVEIKGSEKRGKIVFHYRTREDLERLLNQMQNEKL